jgi:hypothetical protein
VKRPAPTRRRLVVAGLVTVLALAGCSEEADEAVVPPKRAATEPAPPPPQPANARPVECPPALANCSMASGRIIYVERVDPDGDGDAHFVIASSDSITAPGISVIDVKKSLRPSPLPGPGDWISATGPVYEGSHGQSQIEAVRIRVRRREYVGLARGAKIIRTSRPGEPDSSWITHNICRQHRTRARFAAGAGLPVPMKIRPVAVGAEDR